MLNEILNDIVRLKSGDAEPVEIVMTNEARMSAMRDSCNNEMHRYADGEERLFGLPVKTDSTLKKDYEILIK